VGGSELSTELKKIVEIKIGPDRRSGNVGINSFKATLEGRND